MQRSGIMWIQDCPYEKQPQTKPCQSPAFDLQPQLSIRANLPTHDKSSLLATDSKLHNREVTFLTTSYLQLLLVTDSGLEKSDLQVIDNFRLVLFSFFNCCLIMWRHEHIQVLFEIKNVCVCQMFFFLLKCTSTCRLIISQICRSCCVEIMVHIFTLFKTSQCIAISVSNLDKQECCTRKGIPCKKPATLIIWIMICCGES